MNGDEEESSVASSLDDDNDESFCRSYYVALMKELRQNDCKCLHVWHRGVFQLILENIDEFCRVVSSSKGITSVDLGDIQGDDAGPKLDVTEANASAWNKLFQTLGDIGSVQTLLLGGYNLSGMLMGRLLEAMPNVEKIDLFLPWYTISGEDMRVFLEAVSLHPCQNINRLGIYDRYNDGRELDEESLSAEPTNHLEEEGIISGLLRLSSVNSLSIHHIEFTSEECSGFQRILSSETCQMNKLWLYDCSFSGQGGKHFANAIASNVTMTDVRFTDVFQDKTFCDELVSSLALSQSIEYISFKNSIDESVSDSLDVAQLITNVARRNETIVSMRFNGFFPVEDFCMMDGKDLSELQSDVEQSYTLTRLCIGEEEPFEAILKLNTAGRRYLVEDPTSNSKCIAVLAKVKDDLDCLYLHMRENPILCMSFCSGRDLVAKQAMGTKRKASDSFDDKE